MPLDGSSLRRFALPLAIAQLHPPNLAADRLWRLSDELDLAPILVKSGRIAISTDIAGQ